MVDVDCLVNGVEFVELDKPIEREDAPAIQIDQFGDEALGNAFALGDTVGRSVCPPGDFLGLSCRTIEPARCPRGLTMRPAAS